MAFTIKSERVVTVSLMGSVGTGSGDVGKNQGRMVSVVIDVTSYTTGGEVLHAVDFGLSEIFGGHANSIEDPPGGVNGTWEVIPAAGGATAQMEGYNATDGNEYTSTNDKGEVLVTLVGRAFVASNT
jgi:hypothetical protein